MTKDNKNDKSKKRSRKEFDNNNNDDIKKPPTMTWPLSCGVDSAVVRDPR